MSGGKRNIFKYRELTSEVQEVPQNALIAKIPRGQLQGGVLSASQDPVPAELILPSQLPNANPNVVWAYPYSQITPEEISPSSPPRQKNRIKVVFEMAFLGFLVILSCVSLGLQEWTSYCRVSIGLEKAENSSLSDLEDYFCDTGITSNLICLSCSNLELLRQAGQVMLAFGILSILLTVFILVSLGLLFLLRFVLLRGLIAKIAIWVAAGFWILGTAIYFFLFLAVRVDTAEVDVKGGLGLAITVVILQGVNCVMGTIASTHI